MSASSNTSERGLRQSGRLLLSSAGAILLVAAACHLLVNQAEARRHHHLHHHKAASRQANKYEEDNDDENSNSTSIKQGLHMKMDHTNNLVPFVYNQQNCNHGWAYAGVNLLEFYQGRFQGFNEPLSAMWLPSCARPSDRVTYPLDEAFTFARFNGMPTNASYFEVGGRPNKGGRCQGACLTIPDRPSNWKLRGSVGRGQVKSISNANGQISIDKIRSLLDEAPLLVGLNSALIAGTNVDNILPLDCELNNLIGDRINHAVLLVGYGELEGVEYFKYKNSLGPDWGHFGYGYVQIDPNGECNTFASVYLPSIDFKLAEKSPLEADHVALMNEADKMES